MLTSFDKEFKSKDLSKYKIPDVIINLLNSKLPEGLKYKDIGKGICVVDSEKEVGIKVGGLDIEIPTKLKVLRKDKKITFEDIKKYSYNTQTAIRLKPKSNGEIYLNDEKINVNNIICRPLEKENKFINIIEMKPPKFPEPHKITLTTPKGNMEFVMKRKIIDSIDERVIENINNSFLKFKIIINEKLEKINIKISTAENIENFSIKEIRDGIKIYNEVVDGRSKLGTFLIEGMISDKIPDSIISIYDKLFDLENILGKNFIPKREFGEEINSILKLHRCLVEKKPYRINIDDMELITNLTEEKAKELLNKEINIEKVEVGEIDILGVNIKIHTIIRSYETFLSKFNKININNEELKIYLEGEKSFVSMMHFLSEDTMLKVKKDSKKNEMLKNAKKIKFY